MADGAGQALIRGIDIDKASKDYFNEAVIFKNEVTVQATSSREIRWYQKTSGYLSATTPESISALAEGAIPFMLQQTWTRNTSYTKKYMLDSEWISVEDASDSDVALMMEAAKDIVEAIAYDQDGDIWNVASESQTPVNINSVTSTAAWDAGSGQNPAEDVFECEQKIREQTKRKPTNIKIYVSAKGAKDLKTWVIGVGAQITEAASNLVINGTLSMFAGFPLVVSQNVTADYALVGDLKRAVRYREFSQMRSVILTEEMISKKVRASTNGIAILEKPKYVALISNTES